MCEDILINSRAWDRCKELQIWTFKNNLPLHLFFLPQKQNFFIKKKKSSVAFIFLPHKYKFWKLFNFSSWQVTPLTATKHSVEGETQWRMPRNRKKDNSNKNVVYDVRNTYVFHLGAASVFWTLLSSAGGNFLSWKEHRGRTNILRIRQRKRNASCLCAAC